MTTPCFIGIYSHMNNNRKNNKMTAKETIKTISMSYQNQEWLRYEENIWIKHFLNMAYAYHMDTFKEMVKLWGSFQMSIKVKD